jgi:hypothetical protein
MKRPLFIFTIYMFVFMSVMAITGPTTGDEGLKSTAIAQADVVKK